MVYAKARTTMSCVNLPGAKTTMSCVSLSENMSKSEQIGIIETLPGEG